MTTRPHVHLYVIVGGIKYQNGKKWQWQQKQKRYKNADRAKSPETNYFQHATKTA